MTIYAQDTGKLRIMLVGVLILFLGLSMAYWPRDASIDFSGLFAVQADGSVQVPLPVDNMPDFPDCMELETCEWLGSLRRQVTGEDSIVETDLAVDGEIVGRHQMLEIETAEFAELDGLAEAGIDRAWVSHIQVAESYQGNGLGRLMWQAGDAMLKTVAGREAIHIFVDQAGWGKAIMRDVAPDKILYQAEKVWAYVIR